MDPYIKYGFLVPLTLGWGVISIIGGKREWEWLMDPPDWLAFVIPQGSVRLFWGRGAVKIYSIVTGWMLLGIGIIEVLFL